MQEFKNYTEAVEKFIKSFSIEDKHGYYANDCVSALYVSDLNVGNDDLETCGAVVALFW